MTTKIEGSNGIEFPDGTVQSSAAVPSQLAPSGLIADFAMNAAPVGWLECNGAAVSRTTYANLFAAIGTTWGVGDGGTTFNLPDMRGYFRRSVGTNSDGTSSAAFAAKQNDAFKQHSHEGVVGNIANGSMSSGGTLTTPIGNYVIGQTGDAVETRPKNIAVLTCIKV